MNELQQCYMLVRHSRPSPPAKGRLHLTSYICDAIVEPYTSLMLGAKCVGSCIPWPIVPLLQSTHKSTYMYISFKSCMHAA